MLDLEPSTKYEIRIMAGTKEGFPALHDKDWPWVAETTYPESSTGGNYLLVNLLASQEN